MRWAVAVFVVVACGGSDPTECSEGETRECYFGPPGTEGVGACAPGLESCSDGVFSGFCVGDVTPFVEHCDGADEDCNGTVDDVDGSGVACTATDGCEGGMACAGGELTCVSPGKNECGVCGGVEVIGLGTACIAGDCAGELACNTAGDGTECNAPAANACGVCGGPAVVGLGNVCMGTGNCAGHLACDGTGTSSVCDCSENLCNDGLALRPITTPVQGDLVITEVLPNPSQVADALGEWFEVRVLRDVDLNGVALDRAGDTAAPEVTIAFDCIPVTAGSTLVFAKSADPALNGGIPGTVTDTFSFALIDGTVLAPGDVQLLAGATVIDAISWTSTRAGASHQLDPDLIDATSNDSEAAFCDGTTPYGLGDLGTPNADNVQCPVIIPAGSCDDGVTIRPIVKPTVGQLVITEFLANPAPPPVVDGTTDADKEWFEIVNTGATAFDLNELSITRIGVVTPVVVSSAACISVAPNAFALFARSTDPTRNGGLPAVDATFTFALVDSGVNRSIQVFDGTTELDSLTYTAAASSASGLAIQLDPDNFTTSANDVANPTPGVLCQGTVAYGDATNLGTPRAANAQCP